VKAGPAYDIDSAKSNDIYVAKGCELLPGRAREIIMAYLRCMCIVPHVINMDRCENDAGFLIQRITGGWLRSLNTKERATAHSGCKVHITRPLKARWSTAEISSHCESLRLYRRQNVNRKVYEHSHFGKLITCFRHFVR
jgi:hypothetical protein